MTAVQVFYPLSQSHWKTESNISMKYEITHTELTCINILIRTIQEAINRNTFNENEIQNIIKTIKKLNERSS